MLTLHDLQVRQADIVFRGPGQGVGGFCLLADEALAFPKVSQRLLGEGIDGFGVLLRRQITKVTWVRKRRNRFRRGGLRR